MGESSFENSTAGKIIKREAKVFKEFREFIMHGSVMDLAIGVIIGAAFGKIVTSLVNDIIMPPLGLLLGKVNFTDLYINLSSTSYANLADAQAAGAPTINIGVFITTIIQFIIIALVIFFIVKAINKLKRPAPVVEPVTRECPHCHTTISNKADRCPNCTSEIKPLA